MLSECILNVVKKLDFNINLLKNKSDHICVYNT